MTTWKIFYRATGTDPTTGERYDNLNDTGHRVEATTSQEAQRLARKLLRPWSTKVRFTGVGYNYYVEETGR